MENGCRRHVIGIVERKGLKLFEHFNVHSAYLAAMFVGRFTKANNSGIKRWPTTRCLWMYFFLENRWFGIYNIGFVTASSDGRTNWHGVSAEDSEEGTEMYTMWRINFISYSKLWFCYIWGDFLLLSERRSGSLPEHSSWMKCNRDRFLYEYVEVPCLYHSITTHMCLP